MIINRRISVALLVAMTVVAYIPAIRGGYIWDDDDYVTESKVLRSTEGLRQIWCKPGATRQYYPLVHSSFWIEYHLWKLNPLGYHTVNVALHAANAVLLLLVLMRLGVAGAWLAAAIFALHPVHVESVAWITERKNVLSCLFYLAAGLTYLQFALESKRRYWLALSLFVCALLSKTVTASLPAALLLVLWWKRGRLRAADVYPLLLFFVIGVALGAVTVWMEKHSVGAQGEEWAFTSLERMLIAGRALWFYSGKLVWPRPLIFMYPKWQIDPHVWWQYLFPLSAIVVIVALWRLRDRIGRGPVVAVVCFTGTLVPALGFFNVFPFRYSFVADHFQYQASIGLIALAAAGFTLSAQSLNVPRAARGIGCAFLFVGLSWLTWQQGHIYKDAETLWRNTIERNPTCWMAFDNLGIVHSRRGEDLQAAACFEKALRIKPDLPEPHADMGALLARQGHYDAAIDHFEAALRARARFPEAEANLGAALACLGRNEEAKRHLRAALALSPKIPKAHYNLGTILDSEGKSQEAIQHLIEALRLEPEYANAHFALGLVYTKIGDYETASKEFEQSLKLNPQDAEAHFRLGFAQYNRGLVDEAITQYRLALRLKPDLVVALNELAWLSATHPEPKYRNAQQAVELATRACELTGNRQPSCLDTLATAYAEAGRFSDAERLAEIARALAVASRQAKLAAEIEQRLRLYREKHPFREGSSSLPATR
jgi:tetratricopeptide (TPR) repeat protein